MILTPIYIAMTFIKRWRICSFRAKLLQLLNGNTSVSFYKIAENDAETPTLSSKLCLNTKSAQLSDLVEYSPTVRVCSMQPNQCIYMDTWLPCTAGLPFGNISNNSDYEVSHISVLFECETEPRACSPDYNIVSIESIGQLVAWKVDTHLALILKTNVEQLSVVGSVFVSGDFIINHKLPVVRMQTVLMNGSLIKICEPLRGVFSELQDMWRKPASKFQWNIQLATLTKLSRMAENTSKSNNWHIATNDDIIVTNKVECEHITNDGCIDETKPKTHNDDPEDKAIQVETRCSREMQTPVSSIEIQTKVFSKPSLILDLSEKPTNKKSPFVSITSQIKSVTTHKRIVSTTKKEPRCESDNLVDLQTIEKSKLSVKSKCKSNDLPSIRSNKVNRPLMNTKSPNVLVYADSIPTRDSLVSSMKEILDCDRYAIYPVSSGNLEGGAWQGRTVLLAVAGVLKTEVAALILQHLLSGGRILALCSDFLHTVLPYYKTAEVRENEIVQFSYETWQSVKMKHDIFCYQASPAKKQFSTESDKQSSKYMGHIGHELDVQILASEETWRTPSLLQATDLNTNGIAIFSQIHLEVNPSEYLGPEGDLINEARIGIIRKILGDLLGLHIAKFKGHLEYTRGYFLGNHVQKMALVEKLCAQNGQQDLMLNSDNMEIQFCMRGQKPKVEPSDKFMPVMVHECPENFSTVEYYNILQTKEVGRLVIYSDVMTSSQTVVLAMTYAHGLAVVPRQQTKGIGRGGNRWISSPGCAMISLQLFMNDTGSVALAQHLSAVAIVQALKGSTGYEDLDIRIKWPNDIYFGRNVKIGGAVAKAYCRDNIIVMNIGVGVNLNNEVPTTSVNQIIQELNCSKNIKLDPISSEKFLAMYCNKVEHLLENFSDKQGLQRFFEQYYEHWLHNDENVKVLVEGTMEPVSGKIIGLDENGFLKVETENSILTVQPDGNTFDMMSGLIATKR